MKRRDFLHRASALAAALALPACAAPLEGGRARAGKLMTVRGPLPSGEMGVTLTHEHCLASFQPYAERQQRPLVYERAEALQVALPHLLRIRDLGCRTLVDATAVGLGRDVVLLRALAEQSGLNILTTTGNYAAFGYQFLPDYVYRSTPEELARRWIAEWRGGIEGTSVRPGFIKLGVNGGPLSEVEQKLIRAAAITHRATGLTIGVHTGPAVAALEELELLKSLRIQPKAWIWIHAHNETDPARHVAAARQGAWVSFDGLAPETLDRHVSLVLNMRAHGLLNRTLVSHDAGWYHVGEPRGGTFRPFDTAFTAFIPALRAEGFTQEEIDTIFVRNAADAFAIAVRAT